MLANQKSLTSFSRSWRNGRKRVLIPALWQGFISCLCQPCEHRLTVSHGDLATLCRVHGPVTAGHSSCHVRYDQRKDLKRQSTASGLEIVRLVTPPPLWLVRGLSMKLLSVTMPFRSTPMLCRSLSLSSYVSSYPSCEEPLLIIPHRWQLCRARIHALSRFTRICSIGADSEQWTNGSSNTMRQQQIAVPLPQTPRDEPAGFRIVHCTTIIRSGHQVDTAKMAGTCT
ncbi:hypothetical protein KCU89_g131, partial [Aureobasidium melanogenum]